MASEDILPTYEEVMKTYQTPPQVLRFEARTITYGEESSASKIKSFLARPDHSQTDDVHVKKTRKSKVVEVLVKVLTARTPRRLEELEESGSGKTVTLPSFFPPRMFQCTIEHRTRAPH